MKVFHIADLHIGKKMYGHSLTEDQAFILDQIVQLASLHRPDAVLICGDVYDRRDPSAQSVAMLDDFLTRLSDVTKVMMISGNHDSPERLAYAGRLLSSRGVYVSPVYDKTVRRVDLEDRFGCVHFYLLPYIRPSMAARFFELEDAGSYTDAVRAAIGAMDVDFSQRNVLLSHQFVTGASVCESEEILVGGLENVDGSVYDGFDYVALGHIHTPQNVRAGSRIRYAGTPLKYSFSEASDRKSVTQVTLGEKGDVQVDCLGLTPMREVSMITGAFDEVRLSAYGEEKGILDNYLSVTLTDETEALNAFQTLRAVYPNILQMRYERSGRIVDAQIPQEEDIASKSPLELFEDFYRQQNGVEMSDDQAAYVTDLIRQLEASGKR